jgi:hypothetical protein
MAVSVRSVVGGAYSEFAANGNLCTEKLKMPIVFGASNGAQITEETPIGASGCKKTKTLTRAQKLAKSHPEASGNNTSAGRAFPSSALFAPCRS